VDLAEETAVDAMVTEVLRRFGRIDVLVNTAGGFRSGGPVHKTPLQLYDAMLTTNMRTMLVASQAVIPQMIKQESGRIINISAQRALKGSAGTSAYGLSKAAVLHLTESMAVELKKHQIRVNCVLPNTIDTPENRKAMPNADWSRWTPPEAIADVILFLAAEESRAVNGASIPV
jgi:NAD(P)-dependent dehydrogenase (short-subunit alcohol dehydrogenase family)